MNFFFFMANTSLLFLCWISLFVGLCSSDLLPPLYKHACVLMGNKIHCLGGAMRHAPTKEAALTYTDDDTLYGHHLILDVSHPANLSWINSAWKISVAEIEPRADCALVAYNASCFILAGGNVPDIQNISLRYNADQHTWKRLNPAEESTVPKMHYTFDTPLMGARGLRLSASHFMIVGGIPPDNNTVISPNTSYVDVEYNIDVNDTMTAWMVPVTSGGELFEDRSRIFRSELAQGSDSKMYFFGGVTPLNATQNDNYKSGLAYMHFLSLRTYDPTTRTFSYVTPAQPDYLPDMRQLHTVNAVPNTTKMIMYGGINMNGILADACWLYDTKNGLWTEATDAALSKDGPGRRFGHQAVIVGSDTLYVIGGIDGEGTAQGNIHVLNVTTMTWLRNDGFTNTYDQNVTVPHVEGVRAGLAAGAIAGIVIGCVAAVGLVVAVVVIRVMQRKRNLFLASGPAPEGFSPSRPHSDE